MIGFFRRLFRGGAADSPEGRAVAAELKAVFERLLEFALLRFGKDSADERARRASLGPGVLAYLAEFSLNDLLRIEGRGEGERIAPLADVLLDVFKVSPEEAFPLAEEALRLCREGMDAVVEAVGDPPSDFAAFGAKAGLVEGLSAASLAREDYDAAQGDGSQPDEAHLLAFSTLVGRAWLAARPA